jgi:hypothetical protein
MKHKAERWAWLQHYFENHPHGTSILDAEFVYAKENKAPLHYTLWGANKCATLSKDLSAMESCGILERYRLGLAGNWQPGFPTWIWEYSLKTQVGG